MAKPSVSKALVMGGAAALTLVVVTYRRRRAVTSTYRSIVSGVLSATAERPMLKSETQRSQFNETELFPGRVSDNHSHGECASDRNRATDFIVRFSNRLGLRPFFLQSSRSNQRKGFDGSKILFWGKDLNAEHKDAVETDRHVVSLVDTDHYLDMPKLLTSRLQPVVLYTFQPDVAARDSGEYSFTFDKSAKLHYRVSGGGSYEHEVWDYGADCLVAKDTFLGVTTAVSTYLVDKVRVSDDHYLISLTPLARWKGLSAIVAGLLSGKALQRFNPVEGDFIRMSVQRKSGLQISTGIVGQYACATIPASVDNGLATVSQTSSVKLSLPSTLAVLPEGPLEEKRAKASVLLKYHREKLAKPPAAFVFPVELGVRSYAAEPENFDPESKVTLTPYMSPLIHGAFAPFECPANERWCVKGRITDFKRAKPLTMTRFIDKAMDEFCSMLIPEPHSLVPCEVDEVYDRQPRPSQRSILDRSLIEPAQRLFKMFIKREAYGKPGTPRPITTINGEDKREYSRYIYAIAGLLKDQSWYAFGEKPSSVANRVSEVLQHARQAVNTDFSRFDGRVSNLLRDLERKVLIRAFGPSYADTVLELHSSQYNQPAIGRLGTRYNTETARGSGSPETAAFNSIANAFTAYLALRSTHENGAFIGPEEAYTRLGVYGGDDGLTADISPSIYEATAKKLGLVLTVEEVLRGNLGITFLARIYGPNVWYGDNNSCCDILRQLSKFHTTVNLPPNVSALDKLKEKSRSYFLTDANTPVIGTLTRRVIEICGMPDVSESLRPMMRWGSDVDAAVQYPNVDNGWMESYTSTALSKVHFDQERFNDWITKVTRAEELLTPPMCSEIPEAKAQVDVVVDDDVVVVGKKKQTKRRGGKPSQVKPTKPKRGEKPTKKPRTSTPNDRKRS